MRQTGFAAGSRLSGGSCTGRGPIIRWHAQRLCPSACYLCATHEGWRQEMRQTGYAAGSRLSGGSCSGQHLSARVARF